MIWRKMSDLEGMEDYKKYITYSPNSIINTCFGFTLKVYKKSLEGIGNPMLKEMLDISHWMELPEPPKDK